MKSKVPNCTESAERHTIVCTGAAHYTGCDACEHMAIRWDGRHRLQGLGAWLSHGRAAAHVLMGMPILAVVLVAWHLFRRHHAQKAQAKRPEAFSP